MNLRWHADRDVGLISLGVLRILVVAHGLLFDVLGGGLHVAVVVHHAIRLQRVV